MMKRCLRRPRVLRAANRGGAHACPDEHSLAAASSASASGLDLQFMDRGVDPCTDFYEFACGGWTKNQPIPADRSAWGRAQELQERNNTTLRRILEEAGRNASDVDTRKIGDYYASCMDESAINGEGRHAARAGAEQDRGADRPARSAGARRRAPLDGRQRVLQFWRRSRFQGSQHGARDRGSGRTRACRIATTTSATTRSRSSCGRSTSITSAR